MSEVEPQPVRSHQRAGLLDVRAQYVAQGGVKQVGAGVIRLDSTAPFGVDCGMDHVPNPQCASLDFNLMDIVARNRSIGVFDVGSDILSLESARVTDLAPSLGIERCAVEQHFSGFALIQLVALSVA